MSSARSIANEWRVILLGLYFFALPFGNSFQLIGIIMAAIGVADVLRGKVSLKEPVFRWLAVLFLLYWLPMAVSLITTVDFSKSLETVLASLRYLFIGIFIIRSLKSRWLFSHLNLFLFAAVSVWLIDATFQLLMGVNTFDQVLESYASGPFEKSSLGLWLVLLALPFFSSVKDVMNTKLAKWVSPALIVWYAAILILSNDIYGYVAMVGWLAVAMLYIAQSGRKILVPAVVAVVCLSAQFAWQQSLTPEQLLDATQTNVERTHKWPEKKQVGSLDVESVNGFFGSVGARASHNAFPEFTGHSQLDSVENPLLTRPMQFLEIRLETGWFGLVLSVLMVFYLIYISRQSVENGYLGWLFAALIMLFPLNAHTAFYGSYWSSALWILLSLQLVVCAQAAQSKVVEAGSDANSDARKQAS